MNDLAIDMLGYFALSINLISMSVDGEYKLRVISTLANLLYIVYGILINALPIVIGCSIAVALHSIKIHKIKIENKYDLNQNC